MGLPGSGKTTVGRQLARRLRIPFVDSDHVIEQRIGCAIRTFFEHQGEEAFRDIESQVIDELSAHFQGVLSTGGGSVLRPINREHLRTRGQVFYLRATPEEVFRRLKHDRNRPLLQVDDPMKKLRDLYQVRDPLYRETAHYIIETARPSVSGLVNMITTQLELSGELDAFRHDSSPATDSSAP